MCIYSDDLFCFNISQVVGSQARILYSNQTGRIAIAQAFNKAVASGKLKVCRCSACSCLFFAGSPDDSEIAAYHRNVMRICALGYILYNKLVQMIDVLFFKRHSLD